YIGTEIGSNRRLGELNAAGCCGTLGCGIGKLERLLDREVREAFHLEDPAVEDIDLILFGNGQQSLLDRPVRDSIDSIAQGDALIELPFETNEYRLGHIQRHETHGAGKGYET